MSGTTSDSSSASSVRLVGQEDRTQPREGRRPGRAPAPVRAFVVTIRIAVEGHRAVARRGAVLLVEPGEVRLEGGVVDGHLGLEGVAAGEVVPEPDRVPALLAAGLGDRRLVVDAEARLERGRSRPAGPRWWRRSSRLTLSASPASSRCGGLGLRVAADAHPGDGGVARRPCRRRRSARRRTARRRAARGPAGASRRRTRRPCPGAAGQCSGGSSPRGEFRWATSELPDPRRAAAPLRTVASAATSSTNEPARNDQPDASDPMRKPPPGRSSAPRSTGRHQPTANARRTPPGGSQDERRQPGGEGERQPPPLLVQQRAGDAGDRPDDGRAHDGRGGPHSPAKRSASNPSASTGPAVPLTRR